MACLNIPATSSHSLLLTDMYVLKTVGTQRQSQKDLTGFSLLLHNEMLIQIVTYMYVAMYNDAQYVVISCFTHRHIDHNGHTIITSGIRSPIQKEQPLQWTFQHPQATGVNVCVNSPTRRGLTCVPTAPRDGG